ncbi:hypothetical protein ACFLU5_05690 [Bacteroidota bacterium]
MEDYKIILIFANLDDDPDKGASIGWVSNFSNNLKVLVKKLCHRDLEIIKLSEYDIEPDAFEVRPSFVIPVLSKNFFKSPILSSYLEVIHKEIDKVHKKDPEYPATMFLAYKSRIQKGDLPLFAYNETSFHFYSVDSITDYSKEFRDSFDPESERTYWMKLYDIADNIKRNIKKPDPAVKKATGLIKEMGNNAVYLADVGQDLVLERDAIKRELKRNGYLVLPDFDLNTEDEHIDDLIKEYLSQTRLSVHLVGEDQGKLVKGKGNTLVEYENKISSDFAQRINETSKYRSKNAFNRLIWIASSKKNLSVKQKLFIENLRKDAANMDTTEVLEIPIQEFKRYIMVRLEEMVGAPIGVSIPVNTNKKSIYFICEENQVKACKPIADVLLKQGYDVIFSDFKGEAVADRNNHTQFLKECDATLIYYGRDNENWIKSKLIDRLKALGLGRQKSKNPTAVIVKDDENVKEKLNVGDEDVILVGEKEFTKDGIMPFISQIEMN